MEHSDIVNKCSTFHTFTIYWSLWETIAGWAPADLYFVPMLARIYVSGPGRLGLEAYGLGQAWLQVKLYPTFSVANLAILSLDLESF